MEKDIIDRNTEVLINTINQFNSAGLIDLQKLIVNISNTQVNEEEENFDGFLEYINSKYIVNNGMVSVYVKVHKLGNVSVLETLMNCVRRGVFRKLNKVKGKHFFERTGIVTSDMVVRKQ